MVDEALVHTTDATAANAEITTRGGKVRHQLTSHLLVVQLPESAGVESFEHLSPVDPDALQGAERRAAEGWLAKFAAVSAPEAASAASAQSWDAPGFHPPDAPPERRAPRGAEPVFAEEAASRSTGTPTSLTLTGSVAVGVVMVSGPGDAPPWTSVHGALTYVSVSTNGQVWGVNRDDAIYHWSGTAWKSVDGRLRQVSVSDGEVWGVNADDNIYQRHGDHWDQVDGKLTHVSVADDGTVWGVNRDDNIYRRHNDHWDQVDGKLTQISVGRADLIWGVNADDNIYHWTGNGWERIDGKLTHVSVAADGSVWGVNRDDAIYRRNGSAWDRLSGRLVQVSASTANIAWGVNADDQIYTYNAGLGLALSESEKSGIVSEVLEGLRFLAAADPAANVSFVYDWRDITVGVAPGAGDSYEDFEAPWRNAALEQMGHAGSRAGSEEYVRDLRTSKSTDWAYVAYITKYPLHWFAYAGRERLVLHADNDNWGPSAINQVFAHETCHIFGAADEYKDSGCDCDGSGQNDVPNLNCYFCTENQVACLMNANTLSLCLWSRGQLGWSTWEPIAGALTHVSAAVDGSVWGVNRGDSIYQRHGDHWHQVDGKLTQISVARSDLIWGVNADDNIYRWTGNDWERIDGKLIHVSVAVDGSVWGINRDGNIYRRSGGDWQRIDGRLAQVCVARSDLVWGVNADDNIYRWTGNDWERIDGKLTHVSVAEDGAVWGVNADDNIYRRAGSAWQRVPGALRQVSVAASGVVWGVNRSDDIYRRL